jgi:gas vesicle protein
MQNEFESASQEERQSMRQTAEDVREQFASAAESAKEQIGAAASSMKEKARAMADDQKAAGAERLSGFARAINVAADQLQDELPQAASYVREAAAKVDDVSTMIRERSIEDLMHEANRFARANTVAFFGISLAAGFALARFLKSGAASHSHAGHSQPGSAPLPHMQPHPASEAASAPPERFAAIPSRQF